VRERPDCRRPAIVSLLLGRVYHSSQLSNPRQALLYPLKLVGHEVMKIRAKTCRQRVAITPQSLLFSPLHFSQYRVIPLLGDRSTHVYPGTMDPGFRMAVFDGMTSKVTDRCVEFGRCLVEPLRTCLELHDGVGSLDGRCGCPESFEPVITRLEQIVQDIDELVL